MANAPAIAVAGHQIVRVVDFSREVQCEGHHVAVVLVGAEAQPEPTASANVLVYRPSRKLELPKSGLTSAPGHLYNRGHLHFNLAK